ncbi:hypothetical protein ANAPC5_01369 [Anaplasma phagocytophilum]|nr:hypothetical protein ANAPC5_01369 [Anaplasma phagocytophilum]
MSDRWGLPKLQRHLIELSRLFSLVPYADNPSDKYDQTGHHLTATAKRGELSAGRFDETCAFGVQTKASPHFDVRVVVPR